MRAPERSNSHAGDDHAQHDWLRSCHGFRLEVGGRTLGVVEDILYGADSSPAALLVRGGILGTRQTLVAVEDVTEVVPRAKRIVARAGRAATRSF
jgi:hypothetical protein